MKKYQKDFEEFNQQVERKLREGNNSDIIINYHRPPDLPDIIIWMKENLDKLKINGIRYKLENGKFSFSDIEYSIFSPMALKNDKIQ